MIVRAWGTWDLFQSLLLVLRSIADRHGKTIANIATRWVLDHPFVGAVLIGTYILSVKLFGGYMKNVLVY
jgi:diketogulonate reductase-like aldo/keto reductase